MVTFYIVQIYLEYPGRLVKQSLFDFKNSEYIYNIIFFFSQKLIRYTIATPQTSARYNYIYIYDK